MENKLPRRRVSPELRKRRLVIHNLWDKYPTIPGKTDDLNEYLIDVTNIALDALKRVIDCILKQSDNLEGSLCRINELDDDSRALALDMLETMSDILLGCLVQRIVVCVYPENDAESLSVEFQVEVVNRPKDNIVDVISRLVVILVNKAKDR